MAIRELTIPVELHIPVPGVPSPVLVVYASKDGQLLKTTAEQAEEDGVSRWQLFEATQYEYAFSDERLRFHEETAKTDAMFFQSRKTNRAHEGLIKTRSYVGRIRRNVYDETCKCIGTVEFEVRSKKMDYLEQYKFMLSDIAEKCDELLMLQSSPILQTFEVDQSEKANTLYERFAFVKAMLDTEPFWSAVQRVCINPMETVVSVSTEIPVSRIGRVGRAAVRQFVCSGDRVALDCDDEFQGEGIKSLPRRITVDGHVLSRDTEENRFVKFVLENFIAFLEDIDDVAKGKEATESLRRDVKLLIGKLEAMLADPFFREIGRMRRLPLRSPLLQRREGYRQVFRTWILFDCAAKFVWKGGDDVYDAGKRDVATLYEYWVYFELVDAVRKVFRLNGESITDLVKVDGKKLGVQLKRGELINLEAEADVGRRLHVRFSYNRTFSAKDLRVAGSWSVGMRPDYTLSIWPGDLDQKTAEAEDAIVHIHFDAKYRLDKLEQILGQEKPDGVQEESDAEQLDRIKKNEAENIYQQGDLLKMHAYNDAIRRTYGAYVIYPGDVDKPELMREYHELIPGLGAFALRPTSSGGVGLDSLIKFISDIRSVMLDRMTQRERAAIHRNAIYKSKPRTLESFGLQLQDYAKGQKPVIPAEENVIVGYCSLEQLCWASETKRYNFRLDKDVRGSVILTPEFLVARFLLLHNCPDNAFPPVLLRMSDVREVLTGKDLKSLKYPIKASGMASSLYWVVGVRSLFHEIKSVELNLLPGFRNDEVRPCHLPFVTTLEEVLLHSEVFKECSRGYDFEIDELVNVVENWKSRFGT